ncbi:unnamed protein product [Paramecium primaurelia]|uniref:Protein kinase domain-containing protein n=1 Tax=Paramecium primaurelia TaxID=5886 RepID=A0A8S1NNI2_PARPR|nr:unnamed protein product [Paramecium primaurelia]
MKNLRKELDPILIQDIEINYNVFHIQDYYTELFQLKKVISKIILPKTQQLSNYNMLQFIGKGKYSEVQLACEITTGIHVALKIIKKQQIQSIWKSIAQELKIQYLLNHPNNVKLYTFFQTKIQNQKTFSYDMIELNQLISLILSILQNKKDLHNVVLQVTFPLRLLRERIMIKVQICGIWVGETPWEDLSYLEVQEIILSGNIRFPSKFTPESKDFIKKILY